MTGRSPWPPPNYVDIVERLRDIYATHPIVVEAAAEIERLTAEVTQDHALLVASAKEIERLRERVASLQASSGYEASIAQAEIERLRAEIERLVMELAKQVALTIEQHQ